MTLTNIYIPFIIFFLLMIGNSIILNIESKDYVFQISYILIAVYIINNFNSVVNKQNPFLILVTLFVLLLAVLNNSIEIVFIILFSIFLKKFHIKSFELWARFCLYFIIIVLSLWYFGFIEFKQYFAGYDARFLRDDKISLVYRNPNTIFTYLCSCLCIFYKRNQKLFIFTLILFLFCQSYSSSYSSLLAILFTFVSSIIFYKNLQLKKIFVIILFVVITLSPIGIYFFYDYLNVGISNFDLNFLLSGRLDLIRQSFSDLSLQNFFIGFDLERIDNTWIEFISLGFFGIIFIYFYFFRSIDSFLTSHNLDLLTFILIFGLVENMISVSIPLVYYIIYRYKFTNHNYKLT